MKKVSLIGCRLGYDGNLDIPTKNLKECEIAEDELFELVGYEGDTWSGKKVIVHEFCDDIYQTAIPIEKVNLWALMMNKCKRIEGYVPDVNWTNEKINYMEKKYEFTPQLAFANIDTHMKIWAEQTKAKNFVVGISGGKDSTVVAMLLCAIFGKERVYGVMMPQGEQSDIQDSIDVCNILGIRHTTVNIGGSVSAITDEIYKNRSKSGIYPTKDMDINLPARIRMSTLHAIGQCVDGRVINTSNLSEDMVGYATQFGDNAGAYAPLQSLTVTEVKELGKYLIDVLGLNKTYNPFSPILLTETQCEEMSYKKRLIELIDKTPVDGLQAQSDEDRLGFTYAALDKFIRFNEGSDEFKEMIRKKYKQNKFKLEIVQMPQPDFSYLPNFVKD
jgi:NAD+ synthase